MHEADQKRHDAQMKMLKEKGYFMIDGVKSTDLPVEEKSAKKKKAKSGDDSMVAKKRSSGASVGKSKAAGKKAGAADKPAAAGKKAVSKKSDDDLDIEESEALEASDWGFSCLFNMHEAWSTLSIGIYMLSFMLHYNLWIVKCFRVKGVLGFWG